MISLPLYSQGEQYEENESRPSPRARSRRPKEPEAEVEEVETEETEEEEEAPKKQKEKKKQASSGGDGPSPKLIACIVGLVVLLILGGALILFITGTKSKREEVEESKVEESLVAENESMGVLGADTAPLGDDQILGAEQPVLGAETQPQSSDQPLGVGSNSEGTTSSTSGGVGDFNGKTADTLRKWGFTNNQMEIASRDGISAEAMVEQAKQERKEAQWEAMMEAADGASEAYQSLLRQTWLGQPPMDISGFNSTDVMYATESYTENVDYEKVDPSGMQLWVKCFLKNGTTAFMQCPPARYNELDQSGNIVVQYTVVVAGESRIITQINEYRVGN